MKHKSLVPKSKGFIVPKPEILVEVLNERRIVCYSYTVHSMEEAEAMRDGLFNGFEIAGCKSYDVVIKE